MFFNVFAPRLAEAGPRAGLLPHTRWTNSNRAPPSNVFGNCTRASMVAGLDISRGRVGYFTRVRREFQVGPRDFRPPLRQSLAGCRDGPGGAHESSNLRRHKCRKSKISLQLPTPCTTCRLENSVFTQGAGDRRHGLVAGALNRSVALDSRLGGPALRFRATEALNRSVVASFSIKKV